MCLCITMTEASFRIVAFEALIIWLCTDYIAQDPYLALVYRKS